MTDAVLLAQKSVEEKDPEKMAMFTDANAKLIVTDLFGGKIRLYYFLCVVLCRRCLCVHTRERKQ